MVCVKSFCHAGESITEENWDYFLFSIGFALTAGEIEYVIP